MFFGIALYSPKFIENVGGVMRTAYNFQADFINIINGRTYKRTGDTVNSTKQVPTTYFNTSLDFYTHIPEKCKLVSIETSGKTDLTDFIHPKNAIYLFGPEDGGIPLDLQNESDHIISIDTQNCLNLSVTAGIVLYDRYLKTKYKDECKDFLGCLMKF